MTPEGSVAPATRFGPYEIVAPLGAGGMGEVFRARDTRLGRDVALKLLPAEFADDPQRRARFEREARAVAALAHPNILVLYDFGTDHGVPYAVTELLEGETLRQRLREASLPWRKAVEVAVAIAEGLAAAHAKGIIHRDIKPENLFLTADERVKILDFGLAKLDTPPVSEEATTQSFSLGPTKSGAILGTVPYMSPEQVRGQTVDARSDLFSFGCVLYEMLAGKRPFTGATEAGLMASILHDDPPDLGATGKAIPGELQRIVRRCLEKNPEARFQSARDLAFALQSLSAGTGPVEVPPIVRPRRLWPLFVAVLGTVLVALTFVGGMWVERQYHGGPNVETPSSVHVPKAWPGEFLFGDLTPAFGPRVSPDGLSVAFFVLHEGQPRVAVLSLRGGEPRLLTRKSDEGSPLSLCWSADSKLIYFDRYINVPMGVYSVSPSKEADQKPEHILDGAESPQVLKDRSILVCKLDGGGNYRLVRYRPDQEPPEQPVGPVIKFIPGWPQPVRALRESNRVVFCGQLVTDEKKSAAKRRLYLLDLDVNPPALRELWDQDITHEFVQVAVSPDDRFVYTSVAAGDVFHIVRLPIDRSEAGGRPQALLTLTARSYGMDVGEEGRLYIDQMERPLEVLRFDREDLGPPRRIVSTSRVWDAGVSPHPPVELPEDRGILVSSNRNRLLTVGAGMPKPFLSEDWEESMGPIALLGERGLAYVSGARGNRRIKLVELRPPNKVLPIRTAKEIPADGLTSLAASVDGSKLYYVRENQVHAFDVPAKGKDEQPPRPISDGNGVSVNPRTGELIIQQFVKEGVKLYRLDRPDGTMVEFPVKEASFRMTPSPIGDRSTHPDGRILVTVASSDTWFWATAILSPDGTLTPLPGAYDGDMPSATWSRDGKSILATGYPFRSNLYRFSPPTPPWSR